MRENCRRNTTLPIMSQPLIIRTELSNIPMLRDRYPFLYLERGRLEVDDSSVLWLGADGNVIRFPMATISTLLLGPGTTVTHAAVKVLASLNAAVCWVGEDSLLFYSVGTTPTANTYHLKKQVALVQVTGLQLIREKYPPHPLFDNAQYKV